MKTKKLIPIIFVLLVLSVTSVYAADNQFQDVIDLVEDVFIMVGTIFALPLLQEPSTAFGLLLFLFWVAIFAALFYGTGSAFPNMNRRLRGIIGAVPATMVVILMNFETDFFIAVFGGWLIPAIMVLIYALAIIVIRRLFQMEDGMWAHLARGIALLVFSLLLINLEIEKIAEFIEEVARYKAFMLPFFFKKIMEKYKKWY